MSNYFDSDLVVKTVEVSGSLKVILVGCLGRESPDGDVECARNIFLIDRNDVVVWQVTSDFDTQGDPFTNIYFVEDRLQGYRWDGGSYDIDLKTGKAVPSLLIR